MKRLSDLTGIAAEKIFPHNLRHLFARLYYQKTGDLFGLADVLGHSSINITRIYAADTEKRIRDSINRLGILISERERSTNKKKNTT
jgi:site-specific recombinase XerD